MADRGEQIGLSVSEHRRCPSCHGAMKGVGNAYATRGPKTYYKCTTCGHTWTVSVVANATLIEHRQRKIETR